MAPKKAPVPKEDTDIHVDSSDIDKAFKPVKTTIPITKKTKPVNLPKSDPEAETEQETKPKNKEVKENVKEHVKENVKETNKDKEVKEIKEDDEILLDASKISKTKKTGKKSETSVQSNELFNEDDVDYRNVLLNYDFTKNRTLPKITKYEKALLIGKRGKQIEEGANPNVKVLPGQSAIEIAEEELRQRKIPLIIKRPLGNTFEYWRPRDMEVNMD